MGYPPSRWRNPLTLGLIAAVVVLAVLVVLLLVPLGFHYGGGLGNYNAPALNNEITRVQGNLSHSQAELQSNVTAKNSLNSQVSQLNSQVNQDNSQISSLQSKVASDNQNITTLKVTIASDQNRIDQLQNASTSLVSSLQAQVANLQGQIQTDQSEISTLNSEVSSDSTTISSLQTQVSTLQGEYNADQAQINTLNTQITSLNTQIATLQAASLSGEFSSATSCPLFGNCSYTITGAYVNYGQNIANSATVTFTFYSGPSATGQTLCTTTVVLGSVFGRTVTALPSTVCSSATGTSAQSYTWTFAHS